MHALILATALLAAPAEWQLDGDGVLRGHIATDGQTATITLYEPVYRANHATRRRVYWRPWRATGEREW